MQNIWTIARREYNHYFISPIAYVFMFVIFGVMGVLFFISILSMDPTQPQNIPQVQSFLSLYLFPLLFLGIPALTMSTISDEYRSGTLELLLTSPVNDWQLIIGKWFGAFLFLMTTTVITMVYPAILNSLVSPGIDLKTAAACYLGVTLFIAGTSAIGVAISSFFNNQLAALFASIGVLIFFYIVSAPAQVMQTFGMQTGSDIVTYISIPSHFYDTFFAGIIRPDDIFYFLSLTILSLVIGSAAVEARRWR